MRGSIRVLVVDDEETLRNLLNSILEREGYEIECASSVEEARKALQAQAFDVVVSDIKMPKESGYDLLKYVKREFPAIGMILMTGYGDMYTVKDAMLLGADEYITKPFKGFEIAVIVERVYWRMRGAKRESASVVSGQSDSVSE
jgi:two-component system, NtrC family, response regulator PilR